MITLTEPYGGKFHLKASTITSVRPGRGPETFLTAEGKSYVARETDTEILQMIKDAK